MKMEVAVKTLYLSLNPKLVNRKHLGAIFPNRSCNRASVYYQTGQSTHGNFLKLRDYHRCFSSVCSVLSGTQDAVGVSPSQFEDFSVMASSTNEDGELRIRVEVSGTGTRAVFDNVFNKMVAAAQPIPGFRRVKGGKTPDIPREVLLEVLGPSKVCKEVIKKIINSTVAEYVEKEGLEVSKGLRVEQSFEDLEDEFEPDEKFSFDVVIRLQGNK